MLNDILFLTILGLPCWLAWALASLGAFLLGWLLNNLLSGFKAKWQEAEAQLADANDRYANLEASHGELQGKHDSLEVDLAKVRKLLTNCETERIGLLAQINEGPADAKAGFSAAAATGAAAGVLKYGDIFSSDNLQIIEGIGPKIEGLLKAAGFTTWSKLGSAKIEALQKILDEAGPAYKMHNPKSWSEQAALAAAGSWEKLIEYQKFLDGGREDRGDFKSDSKLEKLGMKKLGFSNNPEDLKIIEGVGPKIEGLLKDAGINNWSALAAASVDKLKSILSDAGDRYKLANPSTWPKQAELAASGKWAELAEYQDFLDGGNDPTK